MNTSQELEKHASEFYKSANWFTDKLSDAGQYVSDNVSKGIDNLGNAAGQTAKSWGNIAMAPSKAVASAVGGGLDSLGTSISNAWNGKAQESGGFAERAIGAGLDAGGDSLAESGSNIARHMGNTGSALMGAAKNAFNLTAPGAAINAMGDAPSDIAGRAGRAWDAFTGPAAAPSAAPSAAPPAAAPTATPAPVPAVHKPAPAAAPETDYMKKFQAGTASTYDPKSSMDRRKMALLRQGNKSWANNV